MDSIGEDAQRTLVRDLDGKDHELRELWAGRPVVLAFVRHFG